MSSSSGPDFALSAEQVQIRETAREFARREVDPIVDEIDEAQQFPLRGDARRPPSSASSGVIFPEEYGGAGPGLRRVRAGGDRALEGRSLGRHQRRRPQLARHQPHLQVRQRRAAPALGDAARRAARRSPPGRSPRPGSGSDAAGRAHLGAQGRRRLGAQRLEGVLHPRLGGRHLRGDGDHRSRRAARAATCRPSCSRRAWPGFRSGKKENKLGIRASDTAELVLEDCFVPDENLLGEAGRGLQAGAGDPRRRPHLDRGARARHGDRRLRDRARKYAKQREQFGQPIADVPGDPVRARRDGDAHRRRRER